MTMASANSTTRKKALIIGNTDYKVDPLQCCLNDAEDIYGKLRSFNFDVTLSCNLTYAKMSETILDFIKKIKRGDLVVFFFSGHGTQLNERTYLIPIDNPWFVDKPDLCKSLATCAQTTLDSMVMAEEKPFAVIFLLDCCRGIIESSVGKKGGTITGNLKNFIPMQAHKGSLVVYACGPNQKALDCSRNKRNGLFTYHLLQHIDERNLKVEEMMARVCGGVDKDTNGELQVHRSSCLSTPDVYFNFVKESGEY